MSSTAPAHQALEIVRPLPFLLELLAADSGTARFPLEPGEEDTQGSFNTAALAYLDRVVTPEFKRAAKAIDQVALDVDEGDLILRAQCSLFTIQAALASIGNTSLAVPESTVTWACHRLTDDVYKRLLAAPSKED